MTSRELIRVPGAPGSQWYSDAVRVGALIWTAGQIPRRDDGTIATAFSEQVDCAIDNLERALVAAGGGLKTVVKVNAYLASLDDFDEYNAVYARRLGPDLPARTSVEVARFKDGIRIEIEAVAYSIAEGP
jgi:2-iminobutanoate/2-iminopropanoate deaminase